ncbi:MAG: hypothetical protein IT285_10740 [Bdellovibrionales bacterium]|nr:hypothetical protein [Bdellovibrionales bacterium]
MHKKAQGASASRSLKRKKSSRVARAGAKARGARRPRSHSAGINGPTSAFARGGSTTNVQGWLQRLGGYFGWM